MKKLRHVLLIILVLLLTLSTKVDAKEASASIKLISSTDIPAYVNGLKLSELKTEDSNLYCLEAKNKTPENIMANRNKMLDDGTTYILQNGYPNKSITKDNKKDYYITQVALWWYLDDTKGTANLSTKFKNTDDLVVKEAKKLVDAAKKAPSNNEISYKIDNSNINLNKKDNYYISDEIKLKDQTGLFTYTVKLENAPVGAVVVDSNGKEKNTFDKFDSFSVLVPVDSIKKSTTNIKVIVEATGTNYSTYEYIPVDNNMQHVAMLVTENKKVKQESNILLLIPSKKDSSDKDKTYNTSLTIKKIDNETGLNLEGATIKVYNSRNELVEEFITTNEKHKITNLEYGTYIVEETNAPQGYTIDNNKYEVTLDKNNLNKTITIKNYKEVIVPNTRSNKELIIIILGILISICGIYYVKENKA